MFHLCKSINTGKYRFYGDEYHSFTIIGTWNVANEYRHFVNGTLLVNF